MYQTTNKRTLFDKYLSASDGSKLVCWLDVFQTPPQYLLRESNFVSRPNTSKLLDSACYEPYRSW